jgi:hypothetical protein
MDSPHGRPCELAVDMPARTWNAAAESTWQRSQRGGRRKGDGRRRCWQFRLDRVACAPEIIAREIVEDLTAALAEFEAMAAALEAASVPE